MINLIGKGKTKKDRYPWYDNECRKMKGCLNRAVKRFRNDPFNRGTRDDVFVARKNFKKICRDRESSLRKKLVNELLSFENSDPTEFWKLIKKCRNGAKVRVILRMVFPQVIGTHTFRNC